MKILVKLWPCAVLLLLVYLLVGQLAAVWPWTVDDMYITLRYAQHWAEGQGLLWNLHEPPVEGYSNFSFVWMAKLALQQGFDPVLMLKWMGVLGLCLSALSVYGLTRFWLPASWAWTAVLGLLLYKGEILWAVSGLESSCYQALILAATYCALCGLRGDGENEDRKGGSITTGAYIASAVLLSLASLTRPEAPVFVALFTGLFLLMGAYRGTLVFLLSFALCYLPYFAWHWHYFGRYFPNSVYCKGYVDWNIQLLMDYLKAFWLLLLLAGYAVIRHFDLRQVFLWAPTLIYAVLLTGSESLAAFDNRLFLPAFALLLPLASLGFYFLWEKFDNKLLSSILGVLVLWTIPHGTLTGYREFTVNPVAGMEVRETMRDWLSQHVRPDQPIVLGDAGYVPYRMLAWNFLDSFCLNYKAMSDWPKSERNQRLCQQIMQMKMPYIVITYLQHGSQKIFLYADSCLQDQLRTNKFYRRVQQFVVQMQNDSYHYDIYALQ